MRLYLYHHLGLGDHLICNALVRDRAKKYDEVSVLCKRRNEPSVAFMLRDLDNVAVVSVKDNYEADALLKSVPAQEQEVIGCRGARWRATQGTFDELFYQQAGLAFGTRWSGFFVQRDKASEEKLFEVLCSDEPYAFVHDDKSRGYTIPEGNLPGMPVVRPQKILTENIFDYLLVLERASQVHCIDSAFRVLADSVETKGDMHFHWYPRRATPFDTPRTTKHWKRHDK